MQESVVLNPVIRLSIVSDGLLQFRNPDSKHVTIACNGQELAKILLEPGSFSKNDWVRKFTQSKLNCDEGIASELVQSLEDTFVLIPESCLSNTLGEAIIMHEHLTTRHAKGGIEIPTFSTVGVFGEGAIAGIVNDVVQGIDDLTMVNNQSAELKLAVSDETNIPKVRERYNLAGKSKFKSAMWIDEGCFRIGPFHVKDESACLECFISRVEASSRFYEETKSNNENFIKSSVSLRHGEMEKHLIYYAVERYLRLVMNGQFNRVVPGQLETWNYLTGECETGNVLRNPYCSCNPSSQNPTQAVRDML